MTPDAASVASKVKAAIPRTLALSPTRAVPRQVALSAAYALVSIVVIVGLYVLLWLWQVKEMGVTVNWTGELLSVSPATMAERAGLQPGDYIDFEDYQRLKQFSGEAVVGQLVEVAVSQGGERRSITLEALPSSLSRLLSLGVEPAVGIIFALLGVVPLVARRRGVSLWLFFLAAQLTGLFLIADVPRSFHQRWAEVIAYVAFPLFPAAVFHFHTVFPEPRLGRWRKITVITVYAFAAVLVPLDLFSIWDYSFHVSDPWQWTISLYQALALAASAGLVIRTFATTRDPIVRAQLKTITACVTVGLLVPALVVMLILMFDLDTSNALKSLTIFIGLIVPAGYAYSMVRYNLLTGGLLWRPALVRVIYSSLLNLGLVALVLFIWPGSGALPVSASLVAWAGIVLVVVILAGVQEWLGRWFETHLFKGGSYVELLAFATAELQRFRDLEEFVRFFTEILPTRLKTVGSLVFLSQGEGDPLVLRGHSASLNITAHPLDPHDVPPIPADSELRAVMQAARAPVSLATLLTLPSPALSELDAQIVRTLRAARVELLLPFVSGQQSQLIGLVALGAKETDEAYSGQEVAALSALTNAASTSAENVLMFDAVQKRMVELDQEREFSAALARDVTAAQERERTRISAEIHDTVLQELGVALRLFTRMRDQLQQVLGGLEDSEIALERLSEHIDAGAPTSMGVRARLEIQGMLDECRQAIGSLLGEGGEGAADMRESGSLADNSQLPAAQALPSIGTPDDISGKHLVEDILSLVRSTNQRLREICTDLHPAYLDAPLAKTLWRSVERLCQLYPGVDIAIKTLGIEPPDLSDNAKDVCKKVMEQAIHNALNHARPSRIQVELAFAATIAISSERRLEAAVTLCVADDGGGFEPRSPRYWRSTQRHGLANMYESATLIGASLEIDSSPGRGTRVNLQIPVGA
jgi:signal transduction histidine kinase